jgi:hypothetical protein
MAVLAATLWRLATQAPGGAAAPAEGLWRPTLLRKTAGEAFVLMANLILQRHFARRVS